MSEFKKGDKVRVSKEATHKVGVACRRAKKGFLTGVLMGDKDPCCDCYIVQFTKNIGTDSVFYTKGKMGYCDEVPEKHLTLLRGTVEEVDDEVQVFETGMVVRVTGTESGYDAVKVGDLGVVVDQVGTRVGLRMVYAGPGLHSLSGKTASDRGYWMLTHLIEVVDRVDGVLVYEKPGQPAPLLSQPVLRPLTKVEKGYIISLKAEAKSYDGSHHLGKGSGNWSADRVDLGNGDVYFVIPFGTQDAVVVPENQVTIL